MYKILRPLIFKSDPETAHHATIALLSMGGSMGLGRWLIRCLFPVRKQGPEVKAFGLTFANPLGMAAGYDKEGTAWRGLHCLGFGHVEIGTVTPLAQAGNPKPRVFRLVEDEGVVNHMGFPGKGSEYMLRHVKHKKPAGLVLGINIGKNKNTSNENAAADYVDLVKKFAPRADYLVVNISCPNVEELRSLQDRVALEGLLKAVATERAEQVKKLNRQVPILIKLAPDLTDEQLDDDLDVIEAAQMDGVIISNTTTRREGLKSLNTNKSGGLSGRPLNDLNTLMIRKVHARTGGILPIVASGGVMSTSDAQQKLDSGAVLVQLYTGLIYEGPGLAAKILNEGLRN